MKKLILLISLMFLPVSGVLAQVPSYAEEVKALGIVSGQGMACGASKFDTFEMLARAILISKASSDRQQAEGMKIYNEAKADAYISKRMDGFYECALINRRFDNQDIFKATLYADGTIKMPDGTIITPRQPYDASLVYNQDDMREEAEKIYSAKAMRKVPAGRVQFKTDGAAVANPSYQSGRDAPAILEPVGVQAAELIPTGAAASSSVPAAVSEPSIGHIKRSY